MLKDKFSEEEFLTILEVIRYTFNDDEFTNHISCEMDMKSEEMQTLETKVRRVLNEEE